MERKQKKRIKYFNGVVGSFCKTKTRLFLVLSNGGSCQDASSLRIEVPFFSTLFKEKEKKIKLRLRLYN